MLDKDSVLNTNNIHSNAIHRSTEAAESPVHDYEVSLSPDQSWLVLECSRKALDEIEQAFMTRFDVCAVLNVVR
jgi:hypothetical protein